jgi:hypothetical protein
MYGQAFPPPTAHYPTAARKPGYFDVWMKGGRIFTQAHLTPTVLGKEAETRGGE